MATKLILPQDAPACADDRDSIESFITRETEALQAELFSTTFGLDWDGAWRRAIVELPELLSYAADWDRDAAPPIVFALEAAHAAA